MIKKIQQKAFWRFAVKISCGAFLAISHLIVADEAWLNQALRNIDQSALEGLRDHLKESLDLKNANKSPKPTSQGKCQTGHIANPASPSFVVCLSFSVPEITWISLGKELEQIGGVIALRGLPDNNFAELARRLKRLKKRGFNVQVDINPLLFQKHEVTQVPTFIVLRESSSDQLSGNVSVSFALRQFADQAKNPNSHALLEILNRGLDNSL